MRKWLSDVKVVQVALEAIGLPGKKFAWDVVAGSVQGRGVVAGLARGHMLWLAHCTRLFFQDAGATQKAQVAVVQWRGAQALHSDAELLHSTLEQAPLDRHQAPQPKATGQGY